jgi:alpha-galactosidase
VDLYNTLPATPCDAKHPHDCESVIEGLHRMMSDIWRTLRCRRPGGLLELKQNYGNVLSAQFGTMVRAGDTAYDVDTNLLRCAYIQAYAPVTHNDYLACSVHDSPRDIAVMMIKQMTGGVPTLSMDLTKQPEANLAVIRAWLEFYRSHLPLLSHRRVPLRPDLCLWQVNSREKAILSALFSTCEVPLPERDEVILLNGTGRENFYVRSTEKWAARATWCDHTLQIVRQGRIRVSDGTTLAVPVGGCVALRCP